MLSFIGQLLLWTGFLGGALASVWNLEISNDKWSTVPWLYYGAAALVSASGAAILRYNIISQRKESLGNEGKFNTVEESLNTSARMVSELSQKLPKMTCEDVVKYIDDNCVPVFAEFVDVRQLIANKFGNETYAKVMTEFASGERYVNRSWSAAADGYVDEVEACVNHAHIFFQAAVAELQKAIKSALASSK